MACCTGQTECNHIITIGYLKNFIGNNIQDANGNTVSVNNSDDTYCPTYAELTGGSLIPNFVDAGNGRWSKNVDGITINGSYGSNQSVKQEDLVMTYTRFESLTITATPSTNISECGGSSTMTYTYTLRKYIKSMDGSCTVSTNNSTNRDTSDSGDAAIVYTSNQSWATVSKPTITLAKNGTHDAPARNVTITGAIRFRGTSHSATATIGQKALTGSYKYWYSASTQYYSYDRYSVSPWDFDCNGGTWYGTGYYTTHNWDVYRWQDSCGVNYDNDTVTRNDTYPQYWEPYGSGTVDKIDCSTLSSDYSHTEYESYHGVSDFWRQECKSCSGCTDYTAYTYTDVTASCEDGSATVNYTYTAYTAHVDDAGNCTYTAGESTPGSYSVSWNCSDTSSGDEHVTITGAPCCPAGCRYTYADVELGCDAKDSYTTSVAYTAVCTHEDGTSETIISANTVTIPAVTCNSGEARPIQDRVVADTLEAAKPKITQNGGCPCQAPCDCNELIVEGYTIGPEAGNVTIGAYSAGCVTNISASGSSNWISGINASNGSVTATVAQNTDTNSRTATITVTGKGGTGTTDCTTAFTVTQNPSTCPSAECTCYVVSNATASTVPATATSTTVTWNYSAITWTTASTCIVTSSTETGTASTAVTFAAATCDSNIKSDSFTWSGHKACTSNGCSTGDVTVNWSITQEKPSGCDCKCDDFDISGETSQFENIAQPNATLANITKTGSCITIDSVTTTADWISGLGVSGNYIKGNIAAQAYGSSARTATITVSYKANTSGCTDKTFTITQKGKPCNCTTANFNVDPTSFNVASGASSSVSNKFSWTANCGTVKVEVTSGSSWLSIDQNYTSGKYRYFIVTANDTASARTGTIDVYLDGADSATCRSVVTVTQAAGCSTCNDANIQELSGGATAEGGTNILIGSFSYSCDPGLTAKRVSGGDFITNMTVSNGNVYGTVSPNTTTSERTEVIGIYVGESKCAQYTLAQPAQICTPELTVSATSNCCVNFKVVQPCSDIQRYDIIEWGYSKTNTPIFTNGQAFSSASATGATGISQCPGDISSPYNYYIFWRNRTAHSVSGSQYVTLAGCAATCECSALTLSDTFVSVNAGASTSVTYTAGCVSISSIAASSTGITIDTGTTGTINITGNTSGNYTITIKSSANGTTCTDKTISVTVGCGTIAISPKDSSGDSSGDTVNFSATYTP